MNAQRLRNLTTGRLHTKVEDLYEDTEFIIGETGVMTHNLPNAFLAMQPWLRDKVKDDRFWDGAYDTTHDREIALVPMDEAEQRAFWERYKALPHPFEAIT